MRWKRLEIERYDLNLIRMRYNYYECKLLHDRFIDNLIIAHSVV